MTREDLIWIHKEGRNVDGERFSIEALVHGSGRILVKVWHPQGDSFEYSVIFYVDVPTTVISKPDDAHHFISLESAQQFSEQIVLAFDPLAAPAAKAPAATEADRVPVPAQ